MKLFDLFEARRNKDHPAQQIDRVPNEKRGYAKRSTMERLEKYKDRDDVYISFTDLPKAGLNPASNYDTPIGVYCYPLKYYYEKALKYYKDETDELRYMNITKVIPYAGDRSFLYVLESKKPLPDVSDYSETDWKRDYNKLQEIVGDRRAKKIFDMAVREFKFDFSSTLPFISNLWSVLGFISNYRNFFEYDRPVPDHEIPDFIKSRKETVRKSVFLKRLGYYGFSDKNGLSVIHPNEPVQAFFLSSNDFNVIDKMELSKYRTSHHNKVMKVEDMPQSHIYRFIKKIKKFGDDYEGITKYIFDNKLGHNLKYLPDDVKSFNLINELIKYFDSYQLHTFFNSTLPTKTQIDLLDHNPELLFRIVNPENISEQIINNLDKIDRNLLKSILQTLTYGGVSLTAAQQINIIKDDVTKIKCIPAGFRKLEALQYMVKHAENDIERKTLIKMICLDERHTEFEEWLIDNYFDLVPFKLFTNSGNSYAFRKNPKKYISMVPFNDMPWDIQDMVKKYEDK